MEDSSYPDCTTGLIISNEDSVKINCHERSSALTSPEMFMTGKEKKNWLSMNSIHLSNYSNASRERVINIIKILAELVTSPSIPYPLYIGLFNKTSPGIRTTHINKLAEEISIATKNISEECLQPNSLLFLFPCFSSVVSGFVLGITINWIFGLVFGTSSILLILILIGLILIGSKEKRSSKAVYASKKLAIFMERVRLLLQILFCHPQDTDLIAKPVTPLITVHNLSDYSSPNHLTLAIVESIWTAVEKKYFRFLTRLQSACKITESEKRFKQICCLPTFVVVILFIVAVFINATLLSVYHKREIVMFTNATLLPVFVIMTFIIFLGLFGALPMLFKSFLILMKSPARSLNAMRSNENLDYAVVDNLVKSELEKVCLLISTFEAYQAKEQIRLFIMVNSTDSCNRQKLANCIYLIQNLTTTKTTIPIVTVLGADFNSLVSDWTIMNPIGTEMNFFQQFSDSFHLIHSTFHLPIYIDECFCFSPLIPQKISYSSNEMFCLRGGSSFESLNMAITGSKTTPLPINGTTPQNSIIKTRSFGSRLSLKKIQQMFLARPEFTDINNKIIKQLLVTATFIDKILRINKVDFIWERLIDWITLCTNWPFRMNLILYFIHDDFANIDPKLPIKKFIEEIIDYLKLEVITGRDFVLLAQDDKSFESFQNIIASEFVGNMVIDDLKIFANYSSFLNPYFQSIIKDQLSEHLPNTQSKPHTELPGAVLQTNESHNFSNDDINEEHLKTPVAVRKCFTKVKNCVKMKDLSQMSKKDIIMLLTFIDTIEPSKFTQYQQKLLELNITGLVLSICDLDNLQKELEMNFGDWQIFKALILYLRELETLKISHLSDSEEIGDMSPQMFDNLAFWTEPEQDNDDSENDQSQPKSASSSFTQRDTVPIIEYQKERNIKKAKVKNITKMKGDKTPKMNCKRPFHSGLHLHDLNNAAYASLSENVDKIHPKSRKIIKGQELMSYIPVIIPNANEDHNDENVKQCTCDYWFTFGKEKIPLARVVSEPIGCITSEQVLSREESEDEDFNPRLSYVLPDSVTTNKRS